MDTTDAPQIIELAKKSVEFTPFATRWVPSSARFVVLGQNPRATGTIQVFELSKGAVTRKHKVDKASGFKCGTFGASGLEDRHLATGDYDGKLAIWDLERLSSPVWSAQAHSKIINCIDGCGGLNIGGGAPELVTGSRDGCVRVWDPRVPTPVVSLEPEETDSLRDCWTVGFGNSFNDEERCVVAGYDNGDVKLFDLRTCSLRWEANLGNGVVGLQFDRKDIDMNKLVVATLESRFRVYDMRTQHPEEGFAHLVAKAHKSTVWLAKHLPQNRDVFMTCGGNGGLNVYRYSYPSKRTAKDPEGRLKGVPGTVELMNSRVIGTQPVVSFDWSPDKAGLACLAALDQTVRVIVTTKLERL